MFFYIDKSVKSHKVINNDCVNKDKYYEKKLIKLRKEINELFFNKHFNKVMIAIKKKVSRNFVIKWTQSPDQNFSEDNRGWQKGNRRKWDKTTEEKIKAIYQFLKSDAHQFYTGATAIEQAWRKRYPQDTPPPLRTIGQILSDLGLTESRDKNRSKGAAKYLCYPEYTIYHHFGGRVLESDFIGKKYITGRREPLNFIAFSFKKAPKLRYFKRIEGQTAEAFIKQCGEFFKRFEKPEFIKVDNSLATIGSASGKRNLSKAMRFLLTNRVIPIFAVPKKPFSQASIEGNNSVFARKFWNRIEFQSILEVDEKLEWFNLASQRYTGYQSPIASVAMTNGFRPRVYFIRQVKDDELKERDGFIDVLNERVVLPRAYINYFVLAEWNLKDEMLKIYIERKQRLTTIKRLSFKVNSRSDEPL